mmetsp:Transcript_11407/g.19249  ORF Transcript_11407/g.19249 Transcript_11407/m.19249 type:complete len:111 (-) Transcript_11407:141-473(-)
MVTGKLPFFASFEADLHRKIQGAKYQFPERQPNDKSNSEPQLSNGLRNLIRRTFEVNASRRISASKLMREPWFKNMGVNFDQINTAEQLQKRDTAPSHEEEECNDDREKD